nr:hypothetical protein [Amanita phalloides]
MEKLQDFFAQFIKPKYNKYVLYAHNMSTFDGIFIIEALLEATIAAENPNCRIKPIIKENKIISVGIDYGWDEEIGRFRYHLDIHDSLLLLLSSLEKLSNTFLSDNPEIHKLDNKTLISGILYEDLRSKI